MSSRIIPVSPITIPRTIFPRSIVRHIPVPRRSAPKMLTATAATVFLLSFTGALPSIRLQMMRSSSKRSSPAIPAAIPCPDIPHSNIRKRNDDALWLQMLKKEKYIYGMRSVLMKYRIRQNSISSNKFKVIKYHWILYRDIEHLSIARSVFHIAYWCVIKLLKIK